MSEPTNDEVEKVADLMPASMPPDQRQAVARWHLAQVAALTAERDNLKEINRRECEDWAEADTLLETHGIVMSPPYPPGHLTLIDGINKIAKQRDEARAALETEKRIAAGFCEQRDQLQIKLTEARASCAVKDAALRFYADPRKYLGPNQNPDADEETRGGCYRLDVTWECGKKAVSALSPSIGSDLLAERDRLREALEAMLAAAPHEGEGITRVIACEKAREALAAGKDKE